MELREITKRYPGVLALDGVSIGFEAGEVHAVVGENGAGKSTLMKVMAGAIRPDAGELWFEGTRYEHMSPQLAHRLGIEIVYQEFNPSPLPHGRGKPLRRRTQGARPLDRPQGHGGGSRKAV